MQHVSECPLLGYATSTLDDAFGSIVATTYRPTTVCFPGCLTKSRHCGLGNARLFGGHPIYQRIGPPGD